MTLFVYHGECMEMIRKLGESYSFHVFDFIFGIDGAQNVNTPFFEKITNQIF